MTQDDLLKPRFKLIADYPGNNREVGSVTTEVFTASYFRKFPAIFAEMYWWEDRKQEELPKYLRIVDMGIVCRVDEIVENVGFTYLNNKNKKVFSNNILPATEEEYLTLSPNKEQIYKP